MGPASLVAALTDSSLTPDPVLAAAPVQATASWTRIEVDFVALGLSATDFDGVVIQDGSGGDQGAVYIDEVELLPSDVSTETAEVNSFASLDRRPIDPRIYGVNFGTSTAFADVPYPFRRWGGNSTTRFNWQSDTSHVASDYFFQSIVGEVANPAALPFGSSADQFVSETLALGREPLMTVPIMGWASAAAREKRWSFSVAKYGPQNVDECSFYEPNPPFWCTADSGDGTSDPLVNLTGFCVEGEIVGNDPTDASVAIDTTFVTDWLSHLQGQFGTAGSGGVRAYALDNEPMLWNSTHRDVHPAPATYDEVWNRSLDVATAIKALDPSAEIYGPAVWGWCAYYSSAADLESTGTCIDGPDRAAHDGLAFIPWYLEQSCAVESATGTRRVDVLDIHFYPQGDVSGLGGLSDSEAPADAARRLRSIKELYDPNYVSESWINQPIALIPMMRGWIDQHGAGMDLAMTEYKWGTDNGVSSALAHAEILAIFGREAVDVATRWVAPESGTRIEDAFKLFLDYDGAGSAVSGDSVRALSSDVDDIGAYAVSNESDLHILLFNKSTSEQEVTVQTDGSFGGPLALYRFDGQTGLGSAGSQSTSGSATTITLPPRSATLPTGPFVVPEPGLRTMLALGLLWIARARPARGAGNKSDERPHWT